MFDIIVPYIADHSHYCLKHVQDVEEIIEQIKPTPTLVFGSLLVGHWSYSHFLAVCLCWRTVMLFLNISQLNFCYTL